MLNTDQEWFALVLSIANKSANNKDTIHDAAGYLWDSSNWDRLKYTSHGRFLREVNNVCPDFLLRTRYRKEVLEGSVN